MGLETIAIGAIIKSLAISAATTLATAGVSAFFARGQNVTRGKFEGELQIQNSAFGIALSKVYGGDVAPNYGFGVMKSGVPIFMSDLREVRKKKRQKRRKGRSQTVTEISYVIDRLAILISEAPCEVGQIRLNLQETIFNRFPGALATGVANPSPGPNYDPGAPPNPNAPPGSPVGGSPTVGPGVVSATLSLKEGQAVVRLYRGDAGQSPDPDLESAFTAKYGPNSVNAFRHRAYMVMTGLNVTPYGNQLPNFTFVASNPLERTLRQVAESLCLRAGFVAEEFDFSAYGARVVRGLIINDRRAPREDLEQLFRAYDVDAVEHHGKLIGVVRGGAPVATIPRELLGGEAEITTTIPDPVESPRKLDVTFFDPEKPDKQYEPGNASYFRRTGPFIKEEKVDLQMTLTQSEADAVAKREVQRLHTERTEHIIVLPWRYCGLKPGDTITVETANGEERCVIEEISGAIPGPLTVRAVARPRGAYVGLPEDQGAAPTESMPPLNPPATAAEPIAFVFNAPTIAPGADRYYAAAARFGSGVWRGGSLLIDRAGEAEEIATFATEAVLGVAASALADFTGAPTEFDETSEVIVDLYGDGQLESLPRAEVEAGRNAALLGKEILAFAAAEKLAGFPNRWRLTEFLRGVLDTEPARAVHAVGEAFALLDDAALAEITPPPSDANAELEFLIAPPGRSQDDAQRLNFTWLPNPTRLAAQPNDAASLALSWVGVGVTPSAQTIQYRLAGETAWLNFNAPAAATSATLTGLSANRTYELRIRALRAGQYFFSSVTTATTNPASAVPPREDLPANLAQVIDANGNPLFDAGGNPVVNVLGAVVTDVAGNPLADADGANILSEVIA